MTTTRQTLRTSAPGKVLLLGEHAVVHGTPAIACALDAGIRMEWGHDETPLRIRFVGAPGHAVPEPPGAGDQGSSESADRTASDDGWTVGIEDDHLVASAANAIAAELKLVERPTGVVRAFSALPAGAGLGSSAALCVGLTRLFAGLGGLILDDNATLRAALAGENVFHGNASGLDPAAAISGGLIAFRRGSPPEVSPLHPGCRFDLVVAQVEPGADTRRMVDLVSGRLHRLGSAGTHILETITDLVTSASDAVRNGHPAALGELLDVNHGILSALGASTPALDASCHAARAAGALGAKLTGAGGGGCIVALTTEDRVADVKAALAPRAGFLHTLTLHAEPGRP